MGGKESARSGIYCDGETFAVVILMAFTTGKKIFISADHIQRVSVTRLNYICQSGLRTGRRSRFRA